MKVSIITVVYNNSNTIAEAVESVIKQDYDNIEYIIIDGESDDGTLSILEEYKEHIDVFVSEPDDGLYDAINKGIRHASGDVVGLLHSDDVFASSDVVSTISAEFQSDSSVMGMYGNIKYFRNDKDKIKRSWKADDVYEGYFADGEIFPHTSFFVKKKVHDKIGYYKTDFRIAADYEFILRMVKVHNFKVTYLNKTIIKMRLGGESTKNIFSILITFKEVRKAWRMNGLSPPFTFYIKRYYKKVLQFFN